MTTLRHTLEKDYWLNDLEALNRVYLAAKKTLIEPDSFNLTILAKRIHEAEKSIETGYLPGSKSDPRD